MIDGQDAAPEEIRVRQDERERRHPEDRCPDDSLAADAIADRSAEERSRRNRGEEEKQMQLRAFDRHAELLDEEERVVAADAREVEILREDERDQHRERERRRGVAALNWRPRPPSAPARIRRGVRARETARIPLSHSRQHDDAEQREERKPHDRPLPSRDNDERGEQRPE